MISNKKAGWGKVKAMSIEERTAHKREVSRRWREANPEKTREHDRRKHAKYRDKYLAQMKAKYHADPRAHKNRMLKYNFGITLAEYEAMLERQGHCSAICFADEPGGQGGFHVDHCHVTGKVRGLLCHRCNTGLGLFKDSAALLRHAALYLAG